MTLPVQLPGRLEHDRRRNPRILAIDPGNTESGWCVIDSETRRPVRFGKTNNLDLTGHQPLMQPSALDDEDIYAYESASFLAVEMVASYGMAVGKDVFETCVWTGRFIEWWLGWNTGGTTLVYRRDIKLHHCHSGKATDSNIKQALVDRFASGVRNHGKGTKAEPGWFYGFAADVWQAYALAVYFADVLAPSMSLDAAP